MSSLGYQNQYVFYMLKMCVCVCVDNYIIMIKNRLFKWPQLTDSSKL